MSNVISSFIDPKSPAFIAPIVEGLFDVSTGQTITEQEFYFEGLHKWIVTKTFLLGTRKEDERPDPCCNFCPSHNVFYKKLIGTAGEIRGQKISKKQFLG